MNSARENSSSNQHDQNTSSLKKNSRKRTRNIEQHKQYQQRVKVQSGLEHITKSRKVVPAKVFCEQTDCKCKRKCAVKINIARQKTIFETFYGLPNWSQKTLFLRSFMKSRPTKEDFNPVTIKKRTTYIYFLTNDCGIREEVCFDFFSKCIQVSKKSLYHAMKTTISNEGAHDNRGRVSTRKTRERDLHFVRKFIKKFPCYSSHYGPSASEKKYLHPNLNIKRIYKEYSILCDFKKQKVLSEWKFRHVFNTEFNLGFHPKKSDSCRTCDKLHALVQSEATYTVKKDQLLKQKQQHLNAVKRSRDTFCDIVKHSQSESSKVEVLVFDLQRALEIPSISTSEAFYRRQLWVYNLCIYDEKRKIGYMYIWDESIASRGSQEVSSCLKKHFDKFIPKDTEKIVLYSDACGGQNRNIKTTLMLKKMLDSWPFSELTTIEQRFFISGHSYNSCDRCFGLIERQKNITEQIYIPQHWINIIQQAKKNDPKFVVIEMEKEDFFSSKNFESIITNRKLSVNKDKVEWLKIQKIVNNRSKPFNMTVYNARYDQPIEVSISKRGKSANSIKFENVSFEPLYTQCRPIPRKKFIDLQKLLEFVPTQFQYFFLSLECESEEPKSTRTQKSKDNED